MTSYKNYLYLTQKRNKTIRNFKGSKNLNTKSKTGHEERKRNYEPNLPFNTALS